MRDVITVVARRAFRQCRVSPRVRRDALLVTGGVLAALLLAELWALAHNPNLGQWVGRDYSLYMDATRRWIGGGSFYIPSEVAGPYPLTWGAILYPPQTLLLLVPFTILPWWLWYAIPTAIAVWIVWWQRPALWGWVAIVALMAGNPLEFLVYIVGTPTIWFVAFTALATRWPWTSALIGLKPSLAPFALVGIRDRRWWVVMAGFALIGGLLWPLTLDWVHVALNERGASWLYSLDNLWVLLVPVAAWASSTRRATGP